MPQLPLSPLKLALLLCLSAPLLGQANDITISSDIMAPNSAFAAPFAGDNPEYAAQVVAI